MISLGFDIVKLKKFWEMIFGNENGYADLYFENIYRDNNTIVYSEENEPLGMLIMFPMLGKIGEDEYKVAYIYSIAVHPKHRQKGIAETLLEQAHNLLKYEDFDFSILMPGDHNLIDFYEKKGYEKIYQSYNQKHNIEELKNEETLILVESNLIDMSELREQYSMNNTIFGDMDKISLKYLHLEPEYLKGITMQFNGGYMRCYLKDDGIYIKEIACEKEMYLPAVKSAMIYFKMENAYVRYRCVNKENKIPFGVIKWYNDETRQRYLDGDDVLPQKQKNTYSLKEKL